MRISRSSTVAVAVLVLALTGAACGSSKSSSSVASPPTTTTSTKSAFCAGVVTLDKASVNTNSPADFLALLQSKKTLVADLVKNVPRDSFQPTAQTFAGALSAAISSNSVTPLNAPGAESSSTSVNTYCEVQGDGTPLPADFGQGKGTTFCADEAALSAGVSTAANSAAVVAFLTANQAKIDDFAKNIPPAVAPDANALLTAARAVLSTKDAGPLTTPAANAAVLHIASYCGINQ